MSDTLKAKPAQITPANPDLVNVVQITDCHIFAAPEDLMRGMNTRRSFEAVSKAAIRNSGNLDLLLATGDLSQDGSDESYAYLSRQFDDIGIATFWLPGNHDEIDTMLERLAGKQVDAAKHILIAGWQIVMLDSTISGEVHGCVSEGQLEFLDQCLEAYPDKHGLVCLHHQALETGSLWIDQLGLLNADRLREKITHHDNVRGVLWGHVHQETQQTIDGIEWMSTPSSCVQFKPNSKDFAIGTEPPGYRYLGLHPDGSISSRVHRVDNF